MSIFAVGNILFGHFEEHKPKGLRWVAYGLICALGLGAVYVHAWWLPRHGINGWTGEPKEKYYALLGVSPRGQDRTGAKGKM